MDRDHGWIHTLLEEAENERMHLLTFLKLRKPSLIFRMSVVATQVTPSHAILYAPRKSDTSFLVGYIHEPLLLHLPRAPAALPPVNSFLRDKHCDSQILTRRARPNSFVGYLEEEAVKTYTDILDAIDKGAGPVANSHGLRDAFQHRNAICLLP